MEKTMDRSYIPPLLNRRTPDAVMYDNHRNSMDSAENFDKFNNMDRDNSMKQQNTNES